MSDVLDSVIAAGNSFQMVRAEKLKERLLKLLIVQEGIHKRFWLAEWRQRNGWHMCIWFLRYGGWLVKRLLYVVLLCQVGYTEVVSSTWLGLYHSNWSIVYHFSLFTACHWSCAWISRRSGNFTRGKYHRMSILTVYTLCLKKGTPTLSIVTFKRIDGF